MNTVNELQYKKTIVISKKNYDKLQHMGSMTDTFDSILSRVLDQVKETG
jgi:hypothetical protein